MPNWIEIDDLSRPELDMFTRLTEPQLRNRKEPEMGIFIAESPKVIELALNAGCEPLAFLMERKKAEGTARELLCRCPNVPVYTAEREQLATLTGFALTRGVLCAMRRPPLRSMAEICRGARRIAVLEGIVDATNLGRCLKHGWRTPYHYVWRPASPASCKGQYGNGLSNSLGTHHSALAGTRSNNSA